LPSSRSRVTFGSRDLFVEHPLQDVGGLAISEPTTQIAILSHAEVGVSELIADLPRGRLESSRKLATVLRSM
jgi:hypothetical protein